MPDRAEFIIPSFPRCPDCSAEAHVLTFRPIVRKVAGQGESGPTVYEERELVDFAWRCPNGHQFATAMLDIPLPNWRYSAAN